MKRHVVIVATVLGGSLLGLSAARAADSDVPFCNPDFAGKQTPAELAICNDPSGRSEQYISTTLDLINSDAVPDEARARILKDQQTWYEFMSSQCEGTDLQCIDAMAKKRAQVVQQQVLAAVKTGGGDVTSSLAVQPSADTHGAMDMATLGDLFADQPAEPIQVTSVADTKILTLIKSIDDVAIRLGQMEQAVDREGEIRKIANQMVADHTGVDKRLVGNFVFKPRDSDKSNWVKSHGMKAQATLQNLTKSPRSLERQYLIGEFHFHSDLVEYLDSLTVNDESPEVQRFVASFVKLLVAHRDMAKQTATTEQISLLQ